MDRTKGSAFNGFFSGKRYEVIVSLFGMGGMFYKNSVTGLGLAPGMKALDLGCGTGQLSFALAAISSADCEIFGVDLATDQVGYAKERQKAYSGSFHFSVTSMDEIDFPNETFDLVMTSMALHEAKPEVRRIAIRKACCMLKTGGKFLLVDWGKPRFGGWGTLFYPFCRWGQKDRDNWNNTYRELCESHGLSCKEDKYMNSVIRKQIFMKEPRQNTSEEVMNSTCLTF